MDVTRRRSETAPGPSSQRPRGVYGANNRNHARAKSWPRTTADDTTTVVRYNAVADDITVAEVLLVTPSDGRSLYALASDKGIMGAGYLSRRTS